MELRFMTWLDVAEYLEHDDRLILPIGSVEQHGPRCIFGTDYLIAEALGKKAAESTRTIVAPSPAYGMSIHHLGFAGSATLKPSNMIRAYKDILWSFRQAGFKRIFIINGHGANASTINCLLAQISNQWQEMKFKFKNWWDFSEVTAYIDNAFGTREGKHGTPGETSMIMYLHPGVVREDRELKFREVPELQYFVNYAEFRRLYPDGLIGADPALATAEHGEKIFNTCLQQLIREMSNW
ncbi:creatininase family protein [candidate division KSB1 bacterium]|nr:creatininase family protein [candidate division KSB1 bacterium]